MVDNLNKVGVPVVQQQDSSAVSKQSAKNDAPQGSIFQRKDGEGDYNNPYDSASDSAKYTLYNYGYSKESIDKLSGNQLKDFSELESKAWDSGAIDGKTYNDKQFGSIDEFEKDLKSKSEAKPNLYGTINDGENTDDSVGRMAGEVNTNYNVPKEKAAELIKDYNQDTNFDNESGANSARGAGNANNAQGAYNPEGIRLGSNLVLPTDIGENYKSNGENAYAVVVKPGDSMESVLEHIKKDLNCDDETANQIIGNYTKQNPFGGVVLEPGAINVAKGSDGNWAKYQTGAKPES